MDNTSNAKKDSSFAGFLDSYSKGNVTYQSELLEVYSADLENIKNSIKSLLSAIKAAEYDKQEGLKLYEQLSRAYDVLDSSKEPLIDMLFIALDELSIAMIFYNKFLTSEQAQQSAGQLEEIKGALNIMMVNLLTFVKKINTKLLMEKAIVIANKIK